MVRGGGNNREVSFRGTLKKEILEDDWMFKGNSFQSSGVMTEKRGTRMKKRRGMKIGRGVFVAKKYLRTRVKM